MSPASGASRPTSCPRPGYSAVEIMNAIHRGEIKGLLSSASIPLVSLPDANFTREALESLEFFGVIDFFLSETAQHADVVLAGSLQEEEEGVTCSAEGARHPHSESGRPARQRARRLGHHLRPGAPPGPRRILPLPRAPRDLRRAAGRVARRHRRLLRHHLREDRPEMGVFWPCPSLDHPGTPRLFEGGRFFHPDGKARFM